MLQMPTHTLQRNRLETTPSAFGSASCKGISSKGHHLANLIQEKLLIFHRLQSTLTKANIFLDIIGLDADDDLFAFKLFQAIQHHCIGRIDFKINNQKLYTEAAQMVHLLSTYVSPEYGQEIAKFLLHIEFLTNQIKWQTAEIKAEAKAKECTNNSQRLPWADLMALLKKFPDLDQPTTLAILADAGFNPEICKEKLY